jgi:DDE_Tnp_1-associated
MDSDGAGFAEIAGTMSFLHYFIGLPDHRQAGKVDYPLPEVLLLILLAVLAGAEAFTDIARFGERYHDQHAPNRRCRSRLDRGPELHRDPRCRLASGAPPMARPEVRRCGRKPAHLCRLYPSHRSRTKRGFDCSLPSQAQDRASRLYGHAPAETNMISMNAYRISGR